MTPDNLPFIKAAKFLGAKEGYFFSRGAAGLGYYADEKKTISLTNALGIEQHVDPVTIHLNELFEVRQEPETAVQLVDHGTEKCFAVALQKFYSCALQYIASVQGTPAFPWVEQQDTAGKAKAHARKQSTTTQECKNSTAVHSRQKGALSCSLAGSNHCDEPKKAAQDFLSQEVVRGQTKAKKPQPINAGLATASSWFRSKGLWAIDSANANTWNTLYDYVNVSAADVVLGQEAKVLGGDQAASAESSLRTIKWNGKIGLCDRGPKGGPSAGTLVACRQHIGLSSADDADEVEPSSRFQLQKIGAICKRGIHAGSVYLKDRVGPLGPVQHLDPRRGGKQVSQHQRPMGPGR